jgi:hypothetical protein
MRGINLDSFEVNVDGDALVVTEPCSNHNFTSDVGFLRPGHHELRNGTVSKIPCPMTQRFSEGEKRKRN